MEVQECNPRNKRLYQRCLKNFLNSLRQQHGQAQFKTIAKFNSEQQVWHRIKYTLDEMIYKVLRLLRRI